jgi:hypothetical protein
MFRRRRGHSPVPLRPQQQRVVPRPVAAAESRFLQPLRWQPALSAIASMPQQAARLQAPPAACNSTAACMLRPPLSRSAARRPLADRLGRDQRSPGSLIDDGLWLRPCPSQATRSSPQALLTGSPAPLGILAVSRSKAGACCCSQFTSRPGSAEFAAPSRSSLLKNAPAPLRQGCIAALSPVAPSARSLAASLANRLRPGFRCCAEMQAESVWHGAGNSPLLRRLLGASKNWPWHRLGLHPLQLPQ